MRRTAFLAAGFALAFTASADDLSISRTDNVEARLIAETSGVQPGGTVTLALRLSIREHWHTYWLNPGDSGEATTVDFTLPAGASAGPLQFPYPHRIKVGPLVNFGYDGVVLHMADIKVPADAAPGTVIPVKADATWLVCKDVCIPEEASLTLDVPVVTGTPAASADASEIAATRAALPQESPWAASFAVENNRLTLALDAAPLASAGLKEAVLFPVEAGYIKNAADQAMDMKDGKVVMSTEAGRRFATPDKAAKVTALPALLVLTGQDGQTRAFTVTAKPGAVPALGAGATSGEGAINIWTALLFAFLGGLILNLMPCVFPVLSMKALALAKKGGSDVKAARSGGLAYTAGVVVSFLALGGALIALRSAGEAIGWGFQLQSPIIIAALALLFFVIGLNLMGVFEVGTSLQNAGASAKSDGLSGSFFTGVLAAVVAAPCTAPFMGSAIFTALTQPVPVALAIFGALGLGMAAPYLLLTFSPALVRRMPKPGLWMERLKQVLAFPMFGTAAWLVWVLSVLAGAKEMALMLTALIVAGFALWVYGLIQRGARGWLPRAAALLTGIAAIASIAFMPQTINAKASAMTGSEGGIQWEAYTPAKLETLLGEGKSVFIDLTAAWCITCMANEEVALSSAGIAEDFKKLGIVPLKGDWTNRDPDITKLLEAHGRAGVPLYLFYKAGSRTPAVLPQLLTESIVRDAIGAPSS